MAELDHDATALLSALDLVPLEVLLMITPYLNAKDLLSFCATSRNLQYNTELRESATYWRQLTTSTFRVPNQPIVEHDGKRWMRLYRRMRTHTKVFGWGNNDHGCLGGERSHGRPVAQMGPRRGRLSRAPMHAFQRSSPWPMELDTGVEGGLIADLQCGGWSTVALSTKGVLSLLGKLDGMTFNQRPCLTAQILMYPPGFVSPAERYDVYTAIRQFSAGRSHVLGVADSGRIWSWHDALRPAVHIKFLTIEVRESNKDAPTAKAGRVRKVIAGWNRSTAYIEGTGLVVWMPSNESELRGHSDQSEIDTMLVMEQWIVPHSGYLNSEKDKMKTNNSNVISERDNFGEVKSYAILVDFVLFLTDLGKLFAAKIPDADEDTTQSAPFRVTSDGQDSEVGPHNFIADVQGAFESFAVFKRNGEVLLSNSAYLSALHARHFRLLYTPAPKLRRIPALQNSGVIAMAFGDWHFQALHSDGTISSYGKSSNLCGCLGLGDLPVAVIRGMNLMNEGLLPQCNTSGRRVHFEAEKESWLQYAATKLQPLHTGNHEQRVRNIAVELSEQIETRLKDWGKGPIPLRRLSDAEAAAVRTQDNNDDGLRAYFALSVTAAGWHSGALVLVDEEKAGKVEALYAVKSDVPPEEENDQEAPPEEENGQDPPPVLFGSQTILTRTLSLATSLGRQFLGLPPAGSPRPSSLLATERTRWAWDGENAEGVDENGVPETYNIDRGAAASANTAWAEVEEVDL